MSFVLSFVTFILKNPYYYNIPDDEIAQNYGMISSIIEIIGIFQNCIMGLIFDTLGRKWPLITGLITQSLATSVIPLFSSLFPSFFIIRLLISSSLIITTGVPLLPDYVQTEYIGRANAIIEVIICFAFIFSSSGLFQITNQLSE